MPVRSNPAAIFAARHVRGWTRLAGWVVALAVANPGMVAAAQPDAQEAADARAYVGDGAVPAVDASVPVPAESHATPPPANANADVADADNVDVEEDEPWADDEDEWEDDYDPLTDSPEAIEARRRLVGGGLLMLVGGATVLGAVAMGVSDPCARPAGNSCSRAARNRAALTMGLPGGAVLVAGAVVFGLARRAERRIRVDASVSARRGGILTLTGRF